MDELAVTILGMTEIEMRAVLLYFSGYAPEKTAEKIAEVLKRTRPDA